MREVARGTEFATGSITKVRWGARETGTATAQVFALAQELARSSASLGQEVEPFLPAVKAA